MDILIKKIIKNNDDIDSTGCMDLLRYIGFYSEFILSGKEIMNIFEAFRIIQFGILSFIILAKELLNKLAEPNAEIESLVKELEAEVSELQNVFSISQTTIDVYKGFNLIFDIMNIINSIASLLYDYGFNIIPYTDDG